MASPVSDLYRQRAAEGRLTPDPAQEAVLPALDSIITDLAAPARRGLFRKVDPVRGLYLWGGVGRGKSMLMDLAVAASQVATERRHFHEFMQSVHAGLAEARKRGVDDALLPVADAIADRLRLLAFDEMQITDITDAMIVGRLFERLFARGVTVLTTSNRPPDALYKDGLNRALFLPFIALIKERLGVIELSSATDHRQGRLVATPRYFTPADAVARAAVEELWQDLTHGQTHPLTLTVTGRKVRIPEFENGVARASFYQLCDQPLGPADYLALAQAARVLIVEDIPLLSADNFNQARRFVTLIDALYEARTRLYCTAAAAPDRLYIEGEGSFDFERTASRLAEMQAEDWGRDPA